MSKFIIVNAQEQFINKSGVTADIAKAKTHNTIAAARDFMQEGDRMARVDVVTKFGQTKTTFVGYVEPAEIESAESTTRNLSRKDKLVFVLTNDEGLFFNKKGFTDKKELALTSPNADYLAGYVHSRGVVGYLRQAVSSYVNGVYELKEIGDILVEIPVNVDSVKIVDNEVQVLVAK